MTGRGGTVRAWRTTVAAVRTAGATRTTGAIGERCLEDALQFGGLVAGQLAAGHFASNQVVDLRLQIAGRGPCAASRITRPAALQRGVDVGQRGRERVLIGRADGAGVYFCLQLIL